MRRDEVDIPVLVDGPADGIPLLMINGLGVGLQSWSTFRTGLKNRRTIMIELPSGRSSSDTFARMRGLAKRVAGILRRLDVGRVDVLGYSWGGALAQQFAMDYPSHVRGLILIATNYGIGSPPLAIGPIVRLATTSTTSRASITRLARLIGRSGISGVLGDIDLANYLRLLRQMYAFVGWSSWSHLGGLTSPTLVLAGDRDLLVPVCTTRILGAAIPDARVQILQGAGHSVLFTDRAVEAAGLVDRFLLQLDATPTSKDGLAACR